MSIVLRRAEGEIRWARVVPLAATGVLILLVALELVAFAASPNRDSWIGFDYRLYMDATRRWLSGEGFYAAWQLTGPYVDSSWPILYPPQVLLLFVPFTVMPAILWFAIPSLFTAWIIAWHRPRLWAWPLLLAPFVWPSQWLTYVLGTPTIWIVAALAAGTRWGWPAALVLLKPSLAPFALVGVRTRGWWVVAGLLAGLAVVMAPLTLDWLRAVVNLTGPNSGPLYSLKDLPIMLVPLVAWLCSSRLRGPARSPEPSGGGSST